MTWGVPRRPKISNKLGIPNPREGSDGDIQVRQTGLGARLFAKLGGRWLSNILHDNEIDSPDVFIPKVYIANITMPPNTTGATVHVLPSYIDGSNILGSTIVFPNYGGLSIDIFQHSLDHDTDGGSTVGGGNFVLYRTTGTNKVEIAETGTNLVNRKARLTIFFK